MENILERMRCYGVKVVSVACSISFSCYNQQKWHSSFVALFQFWIEYICRCYTPLNDKLINETLILFLLIEHFLALQSWNWFWSLFSIVYHVLSKIRIVFYFRFWNYNGDDDKNNNSNECFICSLISFFVLKIFSLYFCFQKVIRIYSTLY